MTTTNSPAPIPFTALPDREYAWHAAVAANTDGYGATVIRFAGRWAHLMETLIAGGETLENCAKDCCSAADRDAGGLSGYQYGCAVATLAGIWIHGKALADWNARVRW